MPSIQARFFGPIVRIWVKRRNWGRDDHALARRSRRIFGALRVSQWLATRAVRLTRVDQDGVRGEWLEPKSGKTGDGLILYIHGGGFVSCSPATHRPITVALAALAGHPVFAVEYRLAPEYRFPSGLDDVVGAYRWLSQKYAGRSIAVAGDSAGGGLALSLCLRLRYAGEPMPKVVVGFSPWTDLTGSGDSVKANEGCDQMFYAKTVDDFARAYVSGEADLTDPSASPVFADFHDFPPTLFHVGSTEILLDDSRRIHEKIIAAGGHSELEIFDGVFHAWQMGYQFIPEADDSLRKAAAFIHNHLK